MKEYSPLYLEDRTHVPPPIKEERIIGADRPTLKDPLPRAAGEISLPRRKAITTFQSDEKTREDLSTLPRQTRTNLRTTHANGLQKVIPGLELPNREATPYHGQSQGRCPKMGTPVRPQEAV